MTEQEKQLLLVDLSARLPYHVRCKIWLKDGMTEEGPLDLEHNYADVLLDAFYYNKIKDIKPYLRPIPSMTEEEKKKVCSLNGISSMELNERLKWNMYEKVYTIETFDLFNALHIDYRNLIPKGLAIAVTEDNNPYKE